MGSWGLNAEPTAYTELVRQGILLLVLFGLVDWTDAQIAGILMFVSLCLALFARSKVVPVQTIEQAGTTPKELHAAAAVNVMVAEKKQEAADHVVKMNERKAEIEKDKE